MIGHQTKLNKSNIPKISIRKYDCTCNVCVYISDIISHTHIYINMNGLYEYFSKGIIPYIHISHSDFMFVCTRAYIELARLTRDFAIYIYLMFAYRPYFP